jgi:Ca2+-binding EF-hand superfamily protein
MRTDKDGWYRYWDEDNDGTLQQEEVVRALLKTLKLTTNQDRVRQMRETIAAIWPIFDTDGSGSVDQEEFLR